jgi:tryptophan-rich sensory protein
VERALKVTTIIFIIWAIVFVFWGVRQFVAYNKKKTYKNVR